MPPRRNPEPGSPQQPGLGKQIALDVARGLEFLHAQHIVHLDLKSPNGAALPCSALPCSAFLGIAGRGRNSRTATGHSASSLQQAHCNAGQHAKGILSKPRGTPDADDDDFHVALSAVLLTGDLRAEIGDVGLARFMPNDYMSAAAAMGTFAWAVRAGCNLLLGCTCMLPSDLRLLNFRPR